MRSVKRVVLTSSFAAIGYGQPQQQKPFDETNWTDPSGDDVRPYVKSKTLAERAAWDFIAKEGGGLELAVVNPVGVFGPVLGPDYSTSILIVQRLMDGAVPGCPKLYFGVVDVRDVADLHLRAMTHPAAKGERFLAVAGDFMSMHRDRPGAQGPHGRRGQPRAHASASQLAGAVSLAPRPGGEADPPRVGQAQERDQREGQTRPRLEPALERRMRSSRRPKAWCGWAC